MKTKRRISIILLFCIVVSTISYDKIVKAEAITEQDCIEMDKTIPTLRGKQALAYVDFNHTNGISSDWNGHYYDLAERGNDKLTLSEMQNLKSQYTIIFRAKLNSRGTSENYTGPRDRAVFTIFPNGTTPKDDSSPWCESLAVGMLGGNNNADTHSMYYEIRKNIDDSITELSKGQRNDYDVTRAADVQGDGNWHTIALAQTGNGFNYYVDGRLLDFVDTEELDAKYGYQNIGEVFQSYDEGSDFHAWIGRFYATNGGVIDVRFDWFAFYGETLSTKQVQELSKADEPVIRYYDDIGRYRNQEDGYSYERIKGYTFAGWYSDVSCKYPLNESEANQTKGAYAKYVTDKILQIKCQISEDYNYTTQTEEIVKARSLKFITSVDSLEYRKVGFQLIQHTEQGDKRATVSSNSVCTKLYAAGSDNVTLKYTPQSSFCEKSNYFKAFTLEKLPASDYGVEITATPFWVTQDGTVVYGKQATKTIHEGILSSVLTSSSSLTVYQIEEMFSTVSPWKNDKSIDVKANTYTAQGGYTDGKFVYQAFLERAENDTTNSGTENRVRLCRYDADGTLLINKLVTVSETGISLDHANDITYNSREECFLISHAAPGYTKISYFKLNRDTCDLEYVKTKTIDYNIISIDYQKDKNQYVVGLKYTKAFRILDAEFNAITPELTPVSSTEACTTQGVSCDGNYIYFILHDPNVIAIYRWDGSFVTLIDLENVLSSKGTMYNYEPENISVIGNKMYIGCTYNDDSGKLNGTAGFDGLDTFKFYRIDSSKLVKKE